MDSTPLVKRKETDISKCIFCRQSKKRRETYLTSTPAGVQKVIDTSRTLNDGLLDGLTAEQKQKISYHSSNCYSPYILKGTRVSENVPAGNSREETPELSCLEIDVSLPRTTRSASLSSPEGKKVCVICNQVKFKGDIKLWRICENKRAATFLAAFKFNKDEVYKRCVFFQTVGDIYAADIMYHTNCISNYLLHFERDMARIKEIRNELDKESNDLFSAAVDDLCASLELATKGYTLSECRDSINKNLDEAGKKIMITNRHLKEYLIKKYGHTVGFSCAYRKSESEMFFSTDIHQSELVKKIRSTDVVSECAKILRKENKDYDFQLDTSYCDAKDITLSLAKFENARPPLWSRFTHSLFDKTELGSDKQQVSDTVFQIFHKAISNNTKRTPVTIGFAEAISDLTRSKHLSIMANRLGFGVSYEEVERIDTSIIERTIDLVGDDNRVPIPPHIDDETIIHGAMDNFDDKVTHDSILMLFQNKYDDTVPSDSLISRREYSTTERARKLACALPCQKLIEVHRGNKRGSIPENYVSATQEITEAKTLLDYDVWCFVRYIGSKTVSRYLASFSAINSLLSDEVVTKTSIGFTPILPHPITDFESVYTVMRNFQDVLKQKRQSCGPLWCDEGVYQLAKEIQLLYPDEFGTIFLGLGGFHTEKVVLACCGKLLEAIGARDIFVQCEIYGPVVTDNKVLKGKDYVLCREAMRNITEAVNRVKIEKFMEGRDEDLSLLTGMVQGINDCSNVSIEAEDVHQEQVFKTKWKEVEEYLKNELHSDYCAFKSAHEENSEIWKFWNIFTDQVMPVLNNLTRSFREGNWYLHLQAIRQALPLFFNCNRSNYCRWLPLYFEDCMNLASKHPILHQSFCEGNFVVHHTMRKYSGVPMDQALEKEYNKKAKDVGGIIGITRREESVAKWNLIKHEKGAFTNFMDNVVGYNQADEYSLHHEFSPTTTFNDHRDVESMTKYITQNCDIAKPGKLTNISSGYELSEETNHFLLQGFGIGEAAYQEYRKTRLDDRTAGLFDTIHDPHRKKKKKKKPENAGKADLEKIKNIFIRKIDIARTRGYNIKTLLSYELTDKPYFLTPDGLFLSKGNKAELQPLLKTRSIPSADIEVKMDSSVLLIDFMAEARKIESRRKKFNLKTFGDVITDMWNKFSSIGQRFCRIDIVFDCYKKDSIKSLERQRRSQSSDAVRMTISNMAQPLPPVNEFKRFWSLSENKVGLEQFFISWMIENYQGEKPVYLGGCHLDGVNKCYQLTNGTLIDMPELMCTYDEADDRIMFHLNNAVKIGHCSFAHVMSGDTDIFTCLMYHFLNWRMYGLQELWFHHNGSASPLHESVDALPVEVVRVLPASHALTLCDSTAKIGTKLQAFHAAHKREHFVLAEFGIGVLNDKMVQSAELFLLDCMSRTATRSADTFDDLRYNQYHARGQALTMDKIACTSKTLVKQIKWAYFQCNLWINAATRSSPSIDPQEYGYVLNDDGLLHPDLSIELPIPEDFPHPCHCGKCAKETVCNCRILQIKCCDFCKCKNSGCKNPN